MRIDDERQLSDYAKKRVMEKVGGLYGDFNVGDAVGRNRDGDCSRKIRHITEGIFATTLTNKT